MVVLLQQMNEQISSWNLGWKCPLVNAFILATEHPATAVGLGGCQISLPFVSCLPLQLAEFDMFLFHDLSSDFCMCAVQDLQWFLDCGHLQLNVIELTVCYSEILVLLWWSFALQLLSQQILPVDAKVKEKLAFDF